MQSIHVYRLNVRPTLSLQAVRISMALIIRFRSPKRCEICSGDAFETIATRDRKNEPLETVMCTGCGLVSHATVPTDEELARFYAEDYRVAYHGERVPGARRVVRAWENGRRILDRVAPLIDRGATVFEIGAGIGCTVKQFELAGFRASGVEPNDGFQGFSQTELRASVRHGSLEDVPCRASIDAVLLVHVIEHFGSPRAALERIHTMLRPKGVLYVECPNLAAPFATRARLFHEAHTYNFTPSTLIMLAHICGFEPFSGFQPGLGPNLEMAFRKVKPQPLAIDAGSVAATRDALRRASSVWYHARSSYVRNRARQLCRYAAEHLVAARQLRGILKRCATTVGTQEETHVSRRAA